VPVGAVQHQHGVDIVGQCAAELGPKQAHPIRFRASATFGPVAGLTIGRKGKRIVETFI
jgi:hypothetical protein